MPMTELSVLERVRLVLASSEGDGVVSWEFLRAVEAELAETERVVALQRAAFSGFSEAARTALSSAGYCGDGNIVEMITRALGEAKQAGRAEMFLISNALMEADALFPEDWEGTISERVKRMRKLLTDILGADSPHGLEHALLRAQKHFPGAV